MGGAFTWPSLSDVRSYRQEVKKVVLEVIDNAVLELPVTMDDPLVCGSLALFLLDKLMHCKLVGTGQITE